MQESQEREKTEASGGKKGGFFKIIIAVLIAAAALYAYRTYTAASKKAEAPKPQATEQLVFVKPVVKTDAAHNTAEYVGHVEAIQSVRVVPQVSGEILRVCFKEGSLVKAGQMLFLIDPAPFQATVDTCRAKLEKAKADLDTSEKYYARVQNAEARAVSAADRDNAEGAVLQNRAAVSQAKADLHLAEINLGYTKITSPITGKIGVANFTKGNYVTPATGALATIVQMDPIRVAYTLPDRDYLDQLAAFKKSGAVYKTTLILSNGEEITAQGERDFEDNEIDTSTGTIMMNLRYANADGLLIPGAMVRVRNNPVRSDIVTAVPQVAVTSDSKGDYVYVINGDTASRVSVKLGRDLGDLREVTEGVTEGQNVAVAGLQNLRDGAKVKVGSSDAHKSDDGGSGKAEEAK